MIYTAADREFRCVHETTVSPDARSFSRHAHMDYELLYFLTGRADCMVEHLRYTLREGDLILIPPYDVHCISLTGPETYERIVVDFTADMLPREMLEKIFSDPWVIHTGDLPEIQGVLHRMADYLHRFSGESALLLTKNLTAELLILLESVLPEEIPSFGGYRPIMEEALRYIDEHIADIEGLDELCTRLYVSRAYLHRIFVESTGMSPKRFITSKRLWMAQGRLRLGEKPTQVCLRCGFRDYSSFYRAYKSFFGIAPGSEGHNKSS